MTSPHCLSLGISLLSSLKQGCAYRQKCHSTHAMSNSDPLHLSYSLDKRFQKGYLGRPDRQAEIPGSVGPGHPSELNHLDLKAGNKFLDFVVQLLRPTQAVLCQKCIGTTLESVNKDDAMGYLVRSGSGAHFD